MRFGAFRHLYRNSWTRNLWTDSTHIGQITARDVIKPSSLTIQNQKPIKLSLLDQLLVPPFYTPLVLFYPNNNKQLSSVQPVITKLKESLSEILSIYYPLSGRVYDNLYVYNYDEGVPFVETQVNSNLLDFLKKPKIEQTLNQFLPYQPFLNHAKTETMPMVAIQVSIFYCGGIALGLSMSHKLVDYMTRKTFLASWMAYARSSSHEQITIPDFTVASSRFPPLDSPTRGMKTSTEIDNSFKNLGKKATRRYVFNSESLAILKDKAKSDIVPNPTRYEIVTCFIWQSAMRAAIGLLDCQIQSMARHAVGMRSRTKPCLPENSMGNLVWMAKSSWGPVNHQNIESMKFKELVANAREAFHMVDSDCLSILEGENRTDAIVNSGLDSPVKPSMTNTISLNFGFTSWLRTHEGLDFGWGDPIWVGVMTEVGKDWSRNSAIISEDPRNNNIEAWITLGENLLNAVEEDPEFALATTRNASIL